MARIDPASGHSPFSYNISRPYPFKWFAPIGFTVLLVFMILFSSLNFLSTGYLPHVQTSSNPNATEKEYAWLRKWPSFIFNVRPTCQTTNLAVGTQFSTNQTALTYTLKDVWQQNGTGIQVLSSLPYFNNILEDCQIPMISIDVEKSDLRNVAQITYTTYGETVRSYIRCSIQTPSGLVMFNLTQEYDFVPPDITMQYLWGGFPGTNFLDRNKMTKASLWWGETIMSTYWGLLSSELSELGKSQTQSVFKGMLFFGPYGVPDINQPNFFRIDFRFINDKGISTWPGSYGYSNVKGVEGGIPLLTASMLSARNFYPNVWKSAEALAKSAYSTILIDLGQTNATSNILTDPVALQRYTEVLTKKYVDFNADPGPATNDYDALKSTTGQLGTTPSVISTEYICQVPQRKSTTNLLVSIIVADLVFVQTVWLLFKLAVDFFYLRKDPTSQYCQGCISHIEDGTGSHDDENDANHPTQLLNAIPLTRFGAATGAATSAATSARSPSLGQNDLSEAGVVSREISATRVRTEHHRLGSVTW